MQEFTDEEIYQTADIISGVFTPSLYDLFSEEYGDEYDVTLITEHLKMLYEKNEQYGFIYFIQMLAGAVMYEFPMEFYEMSTVDRYIPIFCSAILEDWLDMAEE